MKRLWPIASMLVLAGCPASEPAPDAATEVFDAGPVDAGPIDAGAPGPIELTFTIDVLGTDGGVTTVGSGSGTAEIDPARSLFIRFPVPLKDYRIRMFDGAEQVLPSDEEARVEDGGMSYQVVLAAPLRPGRSYVFGVEAELSHEITDVSGRGYRDVRVSLKVRGAPEPEPKKKPGRKRRGK